MNPRKLLPFFFLILASAMGYLLYTKVLKPDTGDVKVAEAFTEDFIMQYKDATYGENAEDVHFKLKSWTYRKKHYTLDIDADWIGECCNFINNTRCLVKKNFKIEVKNDGTIYSSKVNEMNSCANQHRVVSFTGNLVATTWIQTMILKSSLSKNEDQ